MKVPEPRKQKSGIWRIQLRLNGISIPVTAATETACRNEAASIKANYKAGKLTVAQKKKLPTLTEAIDAYIEKRENTISPSTLTGYRRIQNGRFKDSMNRPIDELTDWQAICDRELRLMTGKTTKKPITTKTVKNAFFFCRSVLKENGITVADVTFPPPVKHEKLFLDPDQIKKLVGSVSGTPEQLPVLFALHSLRRSELLALDWKNVHLDKRTFDVRGAMVKNENGTFVLKQENKNATSARTLPIMIPALYDALSAVPEEKRIGRVITVNGNTVLYEVNKACRSAGLPEVGTHGLRHSFASLAYHLGMSELETMQLGGWADHDTMREIYTHLAAEDRLKAINKMAAFYGTPVQNAAAE